jgi:UDPglucose--hexose-1-phosphate uridylyltransferase
VGHNDAGSVEDSAETTMELRREVLTTEILDPRRDFAPTELTLEIRWDPLTGHTSRILPAAGLLRTATDDLRELAEQTRPGCPFCAERIEQATPKLPPSIAPEGRIGCGEAVLFPNVLPYSRHSSVSVYSPERHFLPLAEMTGELIADNLAAQVEFVRAVMRVEEQATWASVNANHMLPAGSSVFHPHLQGSVNPAPTTFQRLLAGTPVERFRDYVDEEKRQGRRYLGSTGSIDWLASFAPLGPAELRAFAFGIASPAELTDERVRELATGIASALRLYDELGFNSFNLAIYGAPPEMPGYPLNLRLLARSTLEPLYRSDATWLERLHWEAAVDVAPEALADLAGSRFTR